MRCRLRTRTGRETDLPDADPGTGADATVVGAYDHVGGSSAFVIADVSRDDAWLSVPEERALDVAAWQ